METSGYSSEGSTLLNNSLYSSGKYSIAHDDPKAAAKLATFDRSTKGGEQNRRSLSIDSLTKKNFANDTIVQCSSSNNMNDQQQTSTKLLATSTMIGEKNINATTNNNNNNKNRNLNENYNKATDLRSPTRDKKTYFPFSQSDGVHERRGGFLSFLFTVLMPIVCLVCIGCTVYFTVSTLRMEERLNDLDKRWRTVVNLSPLLEKLANNEMVSQVFVYFLLRMRFLFSFSFFFRLDNKILRRRLVICVRR